MKALLLREYKHLELLDLPQPTPGPGELLVQVAACGICGSDVHGYDGSYRPAHSSYRDGARSRGHRGRRGQRRSVPLHPGIALPSTRPSTVASVRILPPRRGQPLREPPGHWRLLRRIPPRRRLRRICHRAGAHYLSLAGLLVLCGCGDARSGLGRAACGQALADSQAAKPHWSSAPA